MPLNKEAKPILKQTTYKFKTVVMLQTFVIFDELYDNIIIIII